MAVERMRTCESVDELAKESHDRFPHRLEIALNPVDADREDLRPNFRIVGNSEAVDAIPR
jgi:hypothetical protein